MKKHKNSDKVAEIIAAARQLSILVIKQEATTDISRGNLERIASVAELLVANAHPVEPSYDNILERGRVIYAAFPARQTLKNRYRMMIGVWRGAFHNVQHLLAEDIMRKAMEQKIPNGTGSNAGTTIHILREYIVRLRAEVDQLQHELTSVKAATSTSESGPKKTVGSIVVDGEIVILSPVRKWLTAVLSPDSLLQEDETGLRLSNVARPGRLIMDKRVLTVLRSL
ncbi:MAG: hypothetical protein ACOH2J_09850 [Allorhizobium sp.]